MADIFSNLKLPKKPLILAPLAGVSDHPFRRMCTQGGADLTYVEMISATALVYGSQKTFEMLERHPDEKILGVQVTSKTPEEMGRAVQILTEQKRFDTIDINMGCPVQKVVKSGCGSGILKDVSRVYATTLAATQNTDLPVSVKIRLGWDHQSLNYLEVASAIESAGAKWITVHGRTRSDTYEQPVNLEAIGQIKKHLSIPVIGNGNLFHACDGKAMESAALVDGMMISRGALGNPWAFDFLRSKRSELSLDEWEESVLQHLDWQRQAYQKDRTAMGLVCMRKHLLWYLKGWPFAKPIKEKINQMNCYDAIISDLKEFADELRRKGLTIRSLHEEESDAHIGKRFVFDPKWDMDRSYDRGVGDDGL